MAAALRPEPEPEPRTSSQCPVCTLAQSVVDTQDKVYWSRQHIKRSLCVLHPDRRCKCGTEVLHKAFEICLASWQKPRNCAATPAPLPPTTPPPPPLQEPTGTTYKYFVHPSQLLSPRSAPPGLPMGCFSLDMYEKMFGPTSAEYPYGRDCWFGIQKDPVGVYWRSVFWRPGVPRPKNHTFSRKYWCIGLAAEGGKANKPQFSSNSVVFWPWYPRLPKKHLANKPLRDPSEVCSSVTTRHTSTAKVTT